MANIQVIHVAGARPNFMKIGPLVRAFGATNSISQKIVHTGQHYDENLSKVFFDQLAIPRPDINLNIGSFPRLEQIEHIAAAFEPIIRKEKPTGIVVVGDVNSTIASAKVAKSFGVRVAHVEAGLRSFDLEMPEEHNRIETDRIADLLFVTEESGMKNLRDEKISGAAYLVGNVMIDTLVDNLQRIKEAKAFVTLGLENYLQPGHYFVSTFHRPSNVDEPEKLAKLIAIIEAVTAKTKLVLPLHPRTKHSLEKHGQLERLQALANLRLVEPLGYLEFMKLVMESNGVLTDSGGIQEETTYLGVPCITMRENTERPVTTTLGTNILAGTSPESVLDAVNLVLESRGKQGELPPLWDGHAAERIAQIVLREWS